jgi:hypothetical protein
MYEKLDSLILNAIRDGRSPLYTSAVDEEAERIAEATGRESFRVLDGRIQHLRKKGRICWKRRIGWLIVEDTLAAGADVGDDE